MVSLYDFPYWKTINTGTGSRTVATAYIYIYIYIYIYKYIYIYIYIYIYGRLWRAGYGKTVNELYFVYLCTTSSYFVYSEVPNNET